MRDIPGGSLEITNKQKELWRWNNTFVQNSNRNQVNVLEVGQQPQVNFEDSRESVSGVPNGTSFLEKVGEICIFIGFQSA